jgi:predicted nucleotidyltransferase
MTLKPAHIKRLKALFAQEPRIRAVYLFGSQVHGKTHKQSDYDFAFLTKTPFSLDEEAELNLQLMKILEEDRIDCIFLNEAPPILCYEIVCDGKILYTRLTEQQLNTYEMSVIREHFHMTRYYELHQQNLREAFSVKNHGSTT